MGYRHSLLSFANRTASIAFAFDSRLRLPTLYAGHCIWLSRESWNTLFSRYELYTARAIKDNLSGGDTFCDVGANIGLFSLLASKIVGPSGKVFSFEPSPDVFNVLIANVRGSSSIHPMHCGVGNADAVAAFAAQGLSNAASFVEDVTKINAASVPSTPVSKIEVKIRKINSLMKDLSMRPHMVKIDVEGFELEVLKGGTDLLSKSRATLIIEIHPPQLKLSGGTEEALFELLEQHGYAWDVIDRNPNSLYTIVAKPRRYHSD